MRVLLLGGTWFLGRTLAGQALERGWDVTAFTRGRSGLPPAGVRHVAGDRASDADVAALADVGPYDATIDLSTEQTEEPAYVTRVLDALGEGAGRYVLVSTVAALQGWPHTPVGDSSPTWPSRTTAAYTDPDLAAGASDGHAYGIVRAGAELVAAGAPRGHLIVRPGPILGPGEYTGRQIALFARALRGGRWLLPAPAGQPIQPIDVRDVAAFILDQIAGDPAGRAAYNLAAPIGHATYGELIDAVLAATGGTAEPVWVDPTWLTEQGVRQWTEIPLWRTAPGTWAVESGRARAAGFRCRPLAETIRDAWAEAKQRPPVPHQRQADHGMAAAREAELLAAWDAGRRSAG